MLRLKGCGVLLSHPLGRNIAIKHRERVFMPKEMRIDKALKPQKVVKTDEGFLFITAPIAHSGIYQYRKSDGTIQREWVPEDTLFHEDSLNSLQMKPVTNNHPETFVTSQDAHYKTVGQVGQKFLRDGDLLITDFTVMDALAIEAIEQGREQLSPAYTCDVEMTSGVTPSGERYDAIQRNRRYNHLALVDRGRGGPRVTLRADSAMEINDSEKEPTISKPNKEGNMPKVHIDGVDYTIEDQAVASHIGNLTSDLAKADSALEQEKADHSATKAQLDARSEELDAIKADAETEEEFQKRVDARVSLLAKATKVCGEDVKTDASDLELKKAVILKVSPKADMEDKNEAYINARFDMALESFEDKGIISQRADQDPAPVVKKTTQDAFDNHFENRYKGEK